MENGNPTNPTTAAAPSKFCTTCGAQLHMQAEICPKCGVRQAPLPNAAPQGPPSGAPAGTASSKSKGGKGCLIACGVVLALLVVGLLALRSQYPKQLMRAYNASAVSDLRNVATCEVMLYSDYQVYGSSRLGKLPGPGGAKIHILRGPLPAATEDNEGAMISAIGKDGKPVGYSMGISANVVLAAQGGPKGFIALTKHVNSSRVFLTTSQSTQSAGIFFCENKAWIGQVDPGSSTPDSLTDIAGTPCGGSPVSTWQKL